jgi:hypothetical protein
MAGIPSLQSSKILIGDLDPSVTSLSASLGLSSGVLVNAGLNYFGANFIPGIDLAGVNIGPPVAIPGLAVPNSLNVLGLSNFAGITNTEGVINDIAFSNIFGFTSRIGAKVASAFSFDSGMYVNSAIHIKQGPDLANAYLMGPLSNVQQYLGNISGTYGTNAFTQSQINTKKPFDIPHPTKEGWRLRHVCIEGPTADVYVRGKLENSNIIELPEYWRKLVDPETITVNLTPIGTYQELYVDKIEWGVRVVIKNNSSSAINCYYTVYGERADTDKNIPEYQGSYGDYPGDNRQYTFSGTAAISNK